MQLITLLACMLLLFAAPVGADGGPGLEPPSIPAFEYPLLPRSHLWLTRAVTAEVGWASNEGREREQIQIAFILADRHEKRKKLFKDITFVDSIRSYCNGLGTEKEAFTRRQQWLRGLKPVLDYDKPLPRPRAWPRKVNWKTHEAYWKRSWKIIDTWSRGGYVNECPKAKFWGGPMDDPPPGMKIVRCNPKFRNIYYR